MWAGGWTQAQNVQSLGKPEALLYRWGNVLPQHLGLLHHRPFAHALPPLEYPNPHPFPPCEKPQLLSDLADITC